MATRRTVKIVDRCHLYNSKSKITGTSTTITGLKAGKYYIKVVPCYKSGGNVQNGASTSAVKCVIK